MEFKEYYILCLRIKRFIHLVLINDVLVIIVMCAHICVHML